MSIFISHAFADKHHFDNIADALEASAVPYWKLNTVVAGAALSDQLRDAISRSRGCIFIATANSVDSAWCSAELGAFWGAGKRVFVFVADTSLQTDRLPKQFQGHYLETRISRLVQACKEYLAEAPPATHPSAKAASDPPLSLSAIGEAIESAIERVTIRSSAVSAFRQLGAVLQPLSSDSIHADRVDDADKRALQSVLHQFLALSKPAIEEVAARDWPYRVQIMMTSGPWTGYAREETNTSENYLYRPCILFRFDDTFRVISAALTTQVGDMNLDGMRARVPVALAGRGEFGSVVGSGYVTAG